MTAIQQIPAARQAAQTVLPTVITHVSPLAAPETARANQPPEAASTSQPIVPEQADPHAAPCDSSAVPRPGVRGYLRVKRVLDALLAGTALVVLAPAIACVWAAVLVRLGRPALFLQERVTLNGRRFRLGKFRTMLPEVGS